MKYTSDDIKFEKLLPKDFEKLCLELLINYNFHKLTWRQGGADNGRDIEGYFNFINPIETRETKWFFECKHYTAGVPPEHLNSKIAWADAEQPAVLVIFVSSYITTAARTWLEAIRAQKNYKIVIIEGEQLKARLLTFPDMIERFFATNRFEEFFLQIKTHWFRHRILPSFEVIRELSANLDLAKLEINDIAFLIITFYKQYGNFEARDDFYGDFTEDIILPLLTRLKDYSSEEQLEKFNEYENSYGYLDGMGFIDDYEVDEISGVTFQFYELHLNKDKSSEHWKIGFYLFIKGDKKDAFEIFSIDDSDFSSYAKYYNKFLPENISDLAIEFDSSVGMKIIDNTPKLFEDDEEAHT